MIPPKSNATGVTAHGPGLSRGGTEMRMWPMPLSMPPQFSLMPRLPQGRSASARGWHSGRAAKKWQKWPLR